MFTKEKVKKALERLFSFFPEEELELLHDNYEEELEDINPAVLAEAFREKADFADECHVVCRAGDGLEFRKKILFNQKAVRLISCIEDIHEDDKLAVLRCTELWMLVSGKFAAVEYIGTATLDGQNIICGTEYRTFLHYIRSEADIFFDPCDLVCWLDDECMLYLLEKQAKAKGVVPAS